MSGRPNKYSAEFISEIVSLHESGMLIADISTKIGIPANTLTCLREIRRVKGGENERTNFYIASNRIG